MNDDYKDVSGLLEEDVSKVSTDEKVSVADKIDIGDKIELIKPIKPIKPIRMPKFAAMRTMAEYSIPTPVTRKEMYLNVIAGGVSALPTPITREEIYLAKICGMDVTIPIPLTRYEMYLYKLAGGEWDVPAPVTRLEIFLYHNCGYEIEVPEPITREEIYWDGGQPQPTTIEGIPPLTFTSKRTGNLEDYAIYGNTVQNGTPTPDNPIEPEFVGDRTENLFDKTTLENGIYLVANGNKYGNVTNGVRSNVKIKALPNTAYTLSAQSTAIVSLRILEWSNGTFIKQTPKYNISGDISLTVTTDAETTEIAFNIEGENGQYATNIMLNYGSTALPYEPYGYKIPISSAGQAKNIYLGQVPTTRKIKKLVLTGEEGIYRSNFYNRSFAYDNPNISTAITRAFSTHFEGSDIIPTGTQRQKKVFVTNLQGYIFNSIAFGDWQFSGDTNAFKTWLAEQYANGTPVTVWYVLATPETAIVNEPLCKIGDYADSIDFSQAGVEIPVTAGTNTVSVGTEIQPSNMMISYK